MGAPAMLLACNGSLDAFCSLFDVSQAVELLSGHREGRRLSARDGRNDTERRPGTADVWGRGVQENLAPFHAGGHRIVRCTGVEKTFQNAFICFVSS